MTVNPNEYTSPTAGTIKLGTKSLAGTEGIDVLTGTASEAAQPLYYPQNTRPQQSDYAATDQMSNVGAELFDASTSYQSFFDKYKNVEGGVAPLDPNDEGFLASVYYTPPEPPSTPPPPPPPAASTPPADPPSPNVGGYGDPGMPGDPLGYGNASSVFEIDPATGNVVGGENLGLGEIGSNVLGAGKDLITTYSTPAIALNILGEVLGGRTRDDGGAPVEYGGISPVASGGGFGGAAGPGYGGSSAGGGGGGIGAAGRASIGIGTPSSQSFMGIDPGIDPGIFSVNGDAGTDIGISGFSGTTADFGLD